MFRQICRRKKKTLSPDKYEDRPAGSVGRLTHRLLNLRRYSGELLLLVSPVIKAPMRPAPAADTRHLAGNGGGPNKTKEDS